MRESTSSAQFVGVCIDMSINSKMSKFYTTIYDNGKNILHKNKEIMIYFDYNQKEMTKDSYNKIINTNIQVDLETYIAI